ncbi:PEPxxWA-CTERM sorting domain-containing protein [Sandaracinobacteroides saxicola]|uniref:PEPxxWA-CTERM sorting domain-containing protein n=2 Tax=Sandaracinobacteroides saxicola TaxID=2759707 RepID=A0A7G5IMB3_9SPHN|nr:PEPxxWA-CTERM sorting domain-containing protein [Sandaracinobacteroides saxicola]
MWTRSGGGNTGIADLAKGEGTFGYTDITAGVPEPATWALFIAGFGLTGVALRRRPARAAGGVR